MASFDLEISYAQLAVFDASLAEPFNDWADVHVRQGFSWRPGSVSFRTLESAGAITIQVVRSRPLDASASRADRIIAVPFAVPASGELEIASIGSGVSLSLPAGDYELTFEHGMTDDSGMWANLYFASVPRVIAPRIVRADAGLDALAPLVMTAKPA